ncbi:MAG: LysR family transcriptional regulator [Rhodobacteraceae bacterium]|jgi:DNA-binding transcriptional LysR family regulator|uniref:LysR family transcriptional regulator n=1 Tax=Albidovulum sp. TaxID=1872424 RepID=UPI001DA1B4CC|nr:LysR family transcriptional regulator [uncultured Defluviimonas sp.]MCB2127059.1 LysR family transcriptional regulator [Paracoccaceae bacterium]MCC0070392.1 LysR family transcriptional regulator [Paracoccaceae bacterium]
MFDWNDLRHLIAVSRYGSTLAAAKALGVNQSTVHRRLLELERRIGLSLVKRRPAGYRLSEMGEVLIGDVMAVQTAVEHLERKIGALKLDLKGTIRLTCPEPTVPRIAASGLLDRFHARYPNLAVEFVTSDRYLDLAKGEADVAFRSGDPVDESLVGRKICDSVWAVYASRSYIQQHGRPHSIEDLSAHALIGFDGIMQNHRVARWLPTAVPEARIVSRSSSMLGVVSSVAAGVGVAPLPTTLGDAEGTLVQVLPPIAELTRCWYLLTPSDLRRTPRVAAFVDCVLEDIPALKAVLTG